MNHQQQKHNIVNFSEKLSHKTNHLQYFILHHYIAILSSLEKYTPAIKEGSVNHHKKSVRHA